MRRTTSARLLTVAIALVGFGLQPAYGSHAPVPPASDEDQVDAAHHVADGYEIDLTPFGKIQLPRLFVTRGTDGRLGFDFFASTDAAIASGRYHYETDAHAEAEGDESAAHGDGANAAHDEDPVHEEDATPDADDEAAMAPTAEAADADESHEAGVVAPMDGHIVIDLSVTRHLAFVWLVGLLCVVIFVRLARRYASGVGRETAPRGVLQNMMESLILYVRDDIAKANIGPGADKYVPFLLSLWFFILFANLIGLIPLSVTSTANITVTGVLAVFTFVVVQLNGNKHYWQHIFNPPGIPLYVKPILVPIEFLGIFIKPFVLAVRLFANMTAGHMVILSLLGLGFTLKNVYGVAGGAIGTGAGVLFALFIYLIEVLVAFLQAYIFVMLSALYIGQATEEHEHHHEHEHDGESTDLLRLSADSGNGVATIDSQKKVEPALAT